jgi:hypothetical protein
MLAPQPIASVQTTTDLLVALCQRFPKSADQIQAWAPSFKRVLGHLQPARLDAVWSAVIDRWDKNYPPKPFDFERAAGDEAAPLSPTAQRAGVANKALQDRTQRWHRCTDRLVEASLAAYSPKFEEVAQRLGVAADDLRRGARCLWTYGFSKSRASKAALAHVVNGEALPEYLKLSEDDWHGLRRLAEAKRNTPEIFAVDMHGGSRSRAHPEKEARRREQLERVEQRSDAVALEA